MNSKDSMNRLMVSGFFSGTHRVGKLNFTDLILTKIPSRDVMYLKNSMLTDDFKEIMRDKDMVNCIEEFFRYDLNVAETSRNSFLHRNTLLYRLAKIKNMTGLDLKKFDDAVSFKILMFVYRATNNNNNNSNN